METIAQLPPEGIMKVKIFPSLELGKRQLVMYNRIPVNGFSK